MLSWADTVTAVWNEEEIPLALTHPDGLFEGHGPAKAGRTPYHFQVTDRGLHVITVGYRGPKDMLIWVQGQTKTGLTPILKYEWKTLFPAKTK